MAIKKYNGHRSGYGRVREVDYVTEPYEKHKDSDSLIEAEVPVDDEEFVHLGRGERDLTYIGDDVPPSEGV